MKATMHTTNKYGTFVARPLPWGESLAGITTAVRASQEATRDFLGLGVAITDSSCYNLLLMEAGERKKLLEELYTEKGLNLKLGRLTVGACDYSTALYTYDDVVDDTALEHFSIERDQQYIIPIVKEILAIKPDLMLSAAPWSPPGWMKTGGSLGGGYMREKYLECYADYFVKYIKSYEAEGIKIQAVTPQNEPETFWKDTMPACVWHPEIEARFISILRKKFDENGIATKIWCYDHSFAGAQRVAWCLKEFPALQDDCGGIAFHYYKGSIEQTAFLKELYPQLMLHFTEGGPRLYDHYDTDWCKWTLMVIRALKCGYSSFTGWNLMLDETGGPNVGPYFCGGLVTRNSTDGSLNYSGQSKAFRHFACITPESKIYPLEFNRNDKPMFQYTGTPRYYTEGVVVEGSQGQVAVILVNPATEKEQVQFFHDNKWWYIEMMPETSVTVMIEE